MKKIISLLMSVAMVLAIFSAFGFTASAEDYFNYEYNGKKYDRAFVNTEIPNLKISGYYNSTCFIETNSIDLLNLWTEKSVVDVYGSLTLNTIYMNDGEINVMPGATISFNELSSDTGNIFTINNYGGTINVADSILEQDNITVKQMVKKITTGADTGDSNLSMSGVAIPAPTYTVTIPKTIDFGTCDKAMANDTAENRIKTIDVNGLSITYSNLYANEKQVTVTMGSDFKIKNGENTLDFELYDGETKLVTNKVLITANPTEEDTAVNTAKPLTAKLDKSQIKKDGTYRGIVTFTVALDDIA